MYLNLIPLVLLFTINVPALLLLESIGVAVAKVSMASLIPVVASSFSTSLVFFACRPSGESGWSGAAVVAA